MRIRSDAKQNKVQCWRTSEKVVQFRFVQLSSLGGTFLRFDPMHVLRRDESVLEQRSQCHTVIAIGMLGRHATFVAKEKMDAAPADLAQGLFFLDSVGDQ